MEWTLLSIGTFTSLLVYTLLHLIWKEKSHIPQIKGWAQDEIIEKGLVPNAFRYTFFLSHRNRQLGKALPYVSLSIQWSRVSLLSVVYTFHSIGVSHENRSELFWLWKSFSSGCILRVRVKTPCHFRILSSCHLGPIFTRTTLNVSLGCQGYLKSLDRPSESVCIF